LQSATAKQLFFCSVLSLFVFVGCLSAVSLFSTTSQSSRAAAADMKEQEFFLQERNDSEEGTETTTQSLWGDDRRGA
jgi:hypothetical protein